MGQLADAKQLDSVRVTEVSRRFNACRRQLLVLHRQLHCRAQPTRGELWIGMISKLWEPAGLWSL
jgi:hypothetical protein